MNGRCTAPNICACSSGWTGSSCNEGICVLLLTHTQSHIISVIFQRSADQNVSMADVQVLTGAHVSLAGVVHPVRQVR